MDEDPAILTESVSTTICKEFKRIGMKIRYVVIPFAIDKERRRKELTDWDLWGPLIFCLILSM